MKQSILVIAPVMPQARDIEPVAESLAFLNDRYTIDFIDPLIMMQEVADEDYYQLWRDKLALLVNHYAAFFGFSFGGVILQQCFSLLAQTKKPIILFSTPSFSDRALKQKLSRVINLCKAHKLDEALHALYLHVVPQSIDLAKTYAIANPAEATARLIFGLSKVLQTDSRSLIKQTQIDSLHFIGEHSDLVTLQHVISTKASKILTVPGACMRVLQDNPDYCRPLILEALNHAKT